MARKSWRFNGNLGGSGVRTTISRAIATKDAVGVSVAANEPRYARTSILCGAPVVSMVSGTDASTWQVIATGVDSDNATPVCVLYDANNGKLQVHRNSITFTSGTDAQYQYTVAVNAGKGSNSDALASSDDDQAAEAWSPKGGVCCHGFIAAISTVAYNDGGSWRRNRVGIMTCNTANLSGAAGTWWDRSWLSPEVPSCDTADQTNMPTAWAIQQWSALAVNGEAPTTAVICSADYQSTSKRGGVFYVSLASRSNATATDWTVGKFVQALTFSRPTAESTGHCHGGITVPDGAGGFKILISRGDSHGNNAMYSANVSDAGLYDNAASDEGGSSYNSYSGSTGITTPTIINGRVGGIVTGSPPPTIDGAGSETYRRMSMQPVGMAQAGSGEVVALGADEQHTAILLTSSIPLSGGITLTPAFRNHRCHPVAGRTGSTSTSLNTSRLVLQMSHKASNKPTAEIFANVTPQASAYQQNVMCLGAYTPNGVEWGVCWNTKVPEQAKPGFFGNTLIIGSPIGSDNFGVRTIPTPSYLRGRPLMIDAGGKNYLATTTTATKSSGMTADASSELNTSETLPASYTPAPGFGTPIYFAADAASGSSSAKFTVLMASAGSTLPAVTAGSTQILYVQFAIHCAKVADWRSSGNGGVGSKDLAPPNVADHVGSNSCSQGFRFRLQLASTFTGYTENIYITENDGSPRVITIPVLASAIASFSANYTLTLYVESTSASTPIKGWLTPIGVYIGDCAQAPVSATDGGTTIPETSLRIDGFTLGTSAKWAVDWAGKVPTEPMWDMWAPSSHAHTSATRTSTTVTRISGANVGLDSVANAFAGHRLFGNLNSQTASFTDYGLAITSSAYVSTGVHDLTHASHGQASGSWTLIDIHGPSTSMAARPLFALVNADNSRIVAVYADCVAGTLKARYWNGSTWGSYATISGFYFVPEAPVLVSLSYDGAGTITIAASVNGTEVSSTTLSATPNQPLTALIAGDGTSVTPMEWWSGQVYETGTAQTATSRLSNVNSWGNDFVGRTRAYGRAARALRI